jgi:hypothetical protein
MPLVLRLSVELGRIQLCREVFDEKAFSRNVSKVIVAIAIAKTFDAVMICWSWVTALNSKCGSRTSAKVSDMLSIWSFISPS